MTDRQLESTTPDDHVTPNFRLTEFACKDGSPYPPEWVQSRLTPLCQALEVLRAELGNKPMTIVSGYRSPAYNLKIGSTRASQHPAGRAADVVVRGVSPQLVHDTVLRLFDEGRILRTGGGLGRYSTFTHLDVRPAGRLVRWKGSRTGS